MKRKAKVYDANGSFLRELKDAENGKARGMCPLQSDGDGLA